MNDPAHDAAVQRLHARIMGGVPQNIPIAGVDAAGRDNRERNGLGFQCSP